MKVRLKISCTDEFQAAYIHPGFSEKDRLKLEQTVRREVHEVELGKTSGGVPCYKNENVVLFPLCMYEEVL